LDPKEKNFDILLDIRVGLGSEMKFKSGVLNFNEFPVSERIKTLSKEEIWNLARGFKFKSTTLNQELF
jgi:hypothetical protein